MTSWLASLAPAVHPAAAEAHLRRSHLGGQWGEPGAPAAACNAIKDAFSINWQHAQARQCSPPALHGPPVPVPLYKDAGRPCSVPHRALVSLLDACISAWRPQHAVKPYLGSQLVDALARAAAAHRVRQAAHKCVPMRLEASGDAAAGAWPQFCCGPGPPPPPALPRRPPTLQADRIAAESPAARADRPPSCPLKPAPACTASSF